MRYILILILSALSFGAGYTLINPNSDANSLIQGFYRSDGNNIIREELLLEPLIDRQVMSLSALEDGTVRYLDKNSGKAYKLDLDSGEENLIQDTLLINPRRVIWSRADDNFISILGEDKVRLKFNDVTSDGSYYMDESVISAAFSPDGDKTAQIKKTGGEVTISIHSNRGTLEKNIFKGRFDNGNIYWPHPDYLIFQAKSTKGSYVLLKIYMDGKIKTLLEQKEVVRDVWEGHLFIFSKKDEVGPYSIGIGDTAAESIKYIQFNTPSSKCAWFSSKELICGLSNESGYDNLYRVPKDGNPQAIAGQFQNLIIEELLYDPQTKKLIVVNAEDDRMYAVPVE
jgi:WD40 repeat protein